MEPSQQETSPEAQPRRPREKKSVLGGLILIVVGLIFLAERLIPDVTFRDFWPLVLVAIGAALIWNSWNRS
jgi:hypothetical protein